MTLGFRERLRAFLLPRKRRSKQSDSRWDLAKPFLTLNRDDVITWNDAMTGFLILGASGSGKTTGPAAAIAEALLRTPGVGGTVLCAKSSEQALWESYCRKAGRLDDLRIIAPGEAWRFNFLDYEYNRKGAGAGQTHGIVQMLQTLLEVGERNSGGRDSERYWARACTQLMHNVADLLSMATGHVSVPDMYRVAISAPTSFEQLRSEEWKAESFCFQCLAAADKRPKARVQQQDFPLVADYFLKELISLSDRTRSVILSTYTSMLDPLNRGVLRELFCSDTNITPEDAAAGRIILLGIPTKEYNQLGVYSQVLWKAAFQRSIERRQVTEDTPPCFLFADEAANWTTSEDAQFQSTARSSRVVTCYVGQNISGFEAALGGNEKGRTETAALFGNLVHKVLCGNGDPGTNAWASILCGRTRQHFATGSSSHGVDDWTGAAMGLGPAGQTTGGFSESFEADLQPSAFAELRSGFPDGLVDAVIYRNGRPFEASGRNWLKVTFKQQTAR